MATDKDWEYNEEYDLEMRAYTGYIRSGTQLIGTTELRELPDEKCLEDHYRWHSLSDFYVYPEHRGQGAGEYMLEKLIDFAKRKNVALLKKLDQIKPGTDADVLETILLSHGFQQLDENTLYFTPDNSRIEKLK